MKLIPRPIRKEEFEYYAGKPVEELKRDLQRLFDRSKGFHFSINLTGRFISDNEFIITPKWQFAIIKSFERQLSFLKGQITQGGPNRARVKFTVRPNSIIPILFFVVPVIGVLLITDKRSDYGWSEATVAGIFCILIFPSLMLLFGYWAKQGIKARFIKTFNLKPVA